VGTSITQFLEKYFWLVLIMAMALGLAFPVYNDLLMSLIEVMLMVMLFLVFLKIDLVDILERIKDYRLMLYLSVMYLLVIPVFFYYLLLPLDSTLAVGILLLTAMPAGTASPALTDIIKGNTALSMSITIFTSLVAPFTVPFLFTVLGFKQADMDMGQIFYKLALLVFVPMVVSQFVRYFFSRQVQQVRPAFTAINILIMFLFVYATIGSQRVLFINSGWSLLRDVVIVYLAFILLHVFGYLLAHGRPRKDKIAITIGNAYMNNGMAIVLASAYFEPAVLVLAILSEFPWNTLLGPFRRVLRGLSK